MLPALTGDLETLHGNIGARDDRGRQQLSRARYGLGARRLKTGQLATVRVD